MKAIFFVALLVIAAQAANIEEKVEIRWPKWALPLVHLYETLNVEQNQKGFADELNLNETIRAEAKICVDAINKGGKTLVDIVRKGQNNKVLLAVESVGILETIKSQVVEACQPYLETLKKLAIEQGAPMDATRDEPSLRFSFLQQFFYEALDTIISKNSYDYGRVQGKVFKLAAGIDKESRANKYSQLNSTKTPTPGEFNMTTFSTEFWPAFLKTVGKADKFDVNDFIKCGDAQVTIGEKIRELEKNAGPTFFRRMGANIKIGEEIAKMASECWVEVQVLLPIWNKIKQDPIKTLLKIQHNGGLNAGQIGYISAMMAQDFKSMDYALAGEAVGTMFNIQYKDI